MNIIGLKVHCIYICIKWMGSNVCKSSGDWDVPSHCWIWYFSSTITKMTKFTTLWAWPAVLSGRVFSRCVVHNCSLLHCVPWSSTAICTQTWTAPDWGSWKMLLMSRKVVEIFVTKRVGTLFIPSSPLLMLMLSCHCQLAEWLNRAWFTVAILRQCGYDNVLLLLFESFRVFVNNNGLHKTRC